jgi:hypothetical protein
MTRLITDGAEFGDALFFDQRSGVVLSTSNPSPRSGVYSYRMASSSSTTTYKSISASSEIYVRFGLFRYSTGDHTSTFKWLAGTTELGSLRIHTTEHYCQLYTSTGTLVATGATILSYGVWYLIELRVKIADAGTIELKIDGVPELTYSGDTKPGADTTINRVAWITNDGSRYDNIDDIAINDTAGAVDNSWCGDGSVILLKPNANGDASDLTGSDGNQTDNYLLVDEVPADGDTTYNVGSTSGNRDLYGVDDFSGTGKTIRRVWVEARAEDTVAAGGECYLSVKVSGGTERKSAAIPLLTTYTKQLLGTVHTVNPENSAAWSDANLDAIQVGFEVK